MGARSRNAYRIALATFANWCVTDGRHAAHDLERLPRANEKADPRRKRRSLTEDELRRLLAVAADRPPTPALSAAANEEGNSSPTSARKRSPTSATSAENAH
ncbi:hypothetical protein [Limnoglobus roseus]|uniref:hypothetical protein n=1 Tax=Limnoglobus roseus TaxID=2598579 RepID=UPI00143DB857